MIKAENLTKSFGDFVALSGITCSIPQGCIYGMVGSNGAGKSTFLRLVTGVYKADAGTVCIDGAPVFDNPAVKNQMSSISCRAPVWTGWRGCTPRFIPASTGSGTAA